MNLSQVNEIIVRLPLSYRPAAVQAAQVPSARTFTVDGRKLRRAREAVGLSQDGLGRAIGRTAGLIFKAERTTAWNFYLGMKPKLADALGIPLANVVQLLGSDDESVCPEGGDDVSAEICFTPPAPQHAQLLALATDGETPADVVARLVAEGLKKFPAVNGVEFGHRAAAKSESPAGGRRQNPVRGRKKN